MIEGPRKERSTSACSDDRVEIRPAEARVGRWLRRPRNHPRRDASRREIAGIGPLAHRARHRLRDERPQASAAPPCGRRRVMGAKREGDRCWGTKGVRVADAGPFVPAARSALKASPAPPVARRLELGTGAPVDYMTPGRHAAGANFLDGTLPGAPR